MTRYITLSDNGPPSLQYQSDLEWVWHLMLFPEDGKHFSAPDPETQKILAHDPEAAKLSNKYRIESLRRFRKKIIIKNIQRTIYSASDEGELKLSTIGLTGLDALRSDFSDKEWDKIVQKRFNDGYIISHLMHYMLGVYSIDKDEFKKRFGKLEAWREDLGHHITQIQYGKLPKPEGTHALKGSEEDKTKHVREIFAPAAHLWAAYFSPGHPPGHAFNADELPRFLALAEAYRHEANRLKVWSKIYAYLKAPSSKRPLIEVAPPYRVTRMVSVTADGGRRRGVERMFHEPVKPPPVRPPSNPKIKAFLAEKMPRR